jgi:DNA-binding IclR family transcriptional regulator
MKPIKSVSKALSILELFIKSNKSEMTLGEIAEALGLEKTAVSHIVSTLMTHGFIKQQAKRGKYSLGIRTLDFGKAAEKRSRENSGTMSYIADLSQYTNQIVYLATWYGSDVLFSRAYHYAFKLPDNIPHGWFNIPLHNHCMGKIILAELTEEDKDKYFRVIPLTKRAPNSIIEIAQIREQLSVVKKEGVAYEEEECHLNVNGVAAAIKNSENETIGAVYIMGNSFVLTRAELRIITPSLMTCALKISRELENHAEIDDNQ